jgi:hypothetical protein
MRTEQRKQEERRKQELATRKRVLSAIVDKVSAPLTKPDLELVVREFINRLPQEHRALLSERHSPVVAKGKQPKPTAEISSALKNLDEAGYSRLLIEISLLDAACNAHSRDGAERIEAVAKCYRVNLQKISEAVAREFAARRQKSEHRRKHSATGKAARKGNGA